MTPIIVETPIRMRIETAEPVLVTPAEERILEEEVTTEEETLPEEHVDQHEMPTISDEILNIAIKPIKLGFLNGFDIKVEPIEFDLNILTPKRRQKKEPKQELKGIRVE